MTIIRLLNPLRILEFVGWGIVQILAKTGELICRIKP